MSWWFIAHPLNAASWPVACNSSNTSGVKASRSWRHAVSTRPAGMPPSAQHRWNPVRVGDTTAVTVTSTGAGTSDSAPQTALFNWVIKHFLFD
jgi:hypothetical protein